MAYIGANNQPAFQQFAIPIPIGQGGTGAIDSVAAKIGLGVIAGSNDGTFVEAGTTAQRGSATTYKVRYNITLGTFEGSNGSSWGSIGGGAVGDAFYENSKSTTGNYTLADNRNAMAAGPFTINDAHTVTIGNGSTLTFVGG